MNQHEQLMMLQELSRYQEPTLDDKLKNALPAAAFGGTLGGTAGALIGHELGHEDKLALLGAGTGALIGARKGTENIKRDKSFLGTHVEALGGGVAGRFVGDKAGHLSSIPVKAVKHRIRKLGSVGEAGDEVYDQNLTPSRNKKPKISPVFNTEKGGNTDVHYNNANIGRKKNKLEKKISERTKEAEDLSSFIQTQYKKHGGKLKNFAKNQWNNNIKPNLENMYQKSTRKNVAKNLYQDSVKGIKNFAGKHGHEFKGFANRTKNKYFGGNS